MRRTVAMIAVAALVVAGGCTAADEGAGELTEDVPEDVDVVVTVDLDVLEDRETETVVDTLLEETAEGDDPRSLDALIEEAEQEAETNLTVDGLNRVALFGQSPEEPTVGGVETERSYAGVLLGVDWERETVLESVRSSADSFGEDGTYRGVTVYESVNETTDETTYLAAYEEGRWAFSTNRSVVEDVIDVAEGEREAFGGDLREAYDRTREDAFLRYAVTVSERQRELLGAALEEASEDSPVDLTQFSKVTAYSGAYYTENDQIGLSTHLATEDEDAARRLNQTIGALITLGRGTVDPDTPQAEQLDALGTERDDQAVVIRYEIDVETLQELIREQAPEGEGIPASLEASAPVSTVVGDG